ncbi:MAG: hypothetical protein VKM98_06030 [Cyanobacteriota bacterium]|nr:hypothetical protein [Cyanobacteriota bacterium]
MPASVPDISSAPNFADFRFPQEPFAALLRDLGWPDQSHWVQTWRDRGGAALAPEAWRSAPNMDWIWGLALPLLSEVERLAADPRPRIVGLSAGIGTGKSTLCRWLKAAAAEIGVQIDVVSLDDFYLPSPALEASLQGNPWGVCRGLPGCHDTELMLQCLKDWRQGRDVSVPVFDKTLRNGRGDRAGSRPLRGSLLVVEGWLLGVPPPTPWDCSGSDQDTNRAATALSEALGAGMVQELSPAEVDYQAKAQQQLRAYGPIWKQIDRLWRIDATDLRASALWKAQQHSFTLTKPEADQFVRALVVSLPANIWERIESDVLATIDPLRTVHWIGLRPPQPQGDAGPTPA